MKVVLDGIVFSLQDCGGISGMFARLLQGLLDLPDVEVYLLEREDAMHNIFRRGVHVPDDRIIPMPRRPLKAERYLSVGELPVIGGELIGNEMFIFHSSYYRHCVSPRAVNVTTLHDFTYEAMRMRGRLATVVHSFQKRSAVRHSEAVACVSHATANDYKRFYGSTHGHRLLKVIPNAALCKPDNGLCDAERNMNDLLFVGTRAYHKNFRLAVEAVSGTPWRLILCSSTLDSEELKLLETKLQPGQWEAYVFPDNQTLSSIYKRCRCLLYPSSYEGFGIPIVEAQLHGLPVITGDCAASRETGGDAAIVLPDYSSASLKQAISALDDRALYRSLQERGFRNAGRFSWHEIVKAYHELYAECIRRRQGDYR